MQKIGGWRRWAVLGLVICAVPALGACAANTVKNKTVKTSKSAAETPAISASNAQLLAWAETGDVGAQYDLGLSLAESDPKTAMRWLESAALQGYDAAAFELGIIQPNPKRAIEWYSMAAAMGHVGAQFELGEAYLNGRGTVKEVGWGMVWLERAARAGHVEAQYALGNAMLAGGAGSFSRDEALVWLLIAQANKRTGLDAMIEDVKAPLNADLIAVAQQRAAAWYNELNSKAVDDRALTRFAQYALGRLGYDAGIADGLDGGRTQAAIAAFRLAESLGAGGLDGTTLDQLRTRLIAQNR